MKWVEDVMVTVTAETWGGGLETAVSEEKLVPRGRGRHTGQQGCSP